MSILQPIAVSDLAKTIDTNCVSADYTIGSTTYVAQVRRSIVSGDTVIKHVYLTTRSPIGLVSRVRLYNASGQVYAQINPNVQHEALKGRLFEFKFKLEVT